MSTFAGSGGVRPLSHVAPPIQSISDLVGWRLGGEVTGLAGKMEGCRPTGISESVTRASNGDGVWATTCLRIPPCTPYFELCTWHIPSSCAVTVLHNPPVPPFTVASRLQPPAPGVVVPVDVGLGYHRVGIAGPVMIKSYPGAWFKSFRKDAVRSSRAKFFKDENETLDPGEMAR